MRIKDFAVHWEMLNSFKGLSLCFFFHAASPNIAPTFPTNTELVGCLEGGEQKNFGSS